jgi:hypothetical protein
MVTVQPLKKTPGGTDAANPIGRRARDGCATAHPYGAGVYLCPIGDRGHCRNADEERPLLSHTLETAVRRVLRCSCASGRLPRTTSEATPNCGVESAPPSWVVVHYTRFVVRKEGLRLRGVELSTHIAYQSAAHSFLWWAAHVLVSTGSIH